MRFVANILVAMAAVLYSCESSGFYAVFLFIYLGASVVGMNILGHRCVQDNTPLSDLDPVDFAFFGGGRDPRCHSRYLTAKAEAMSRL
jgi:hypothetical protein